MISHDVRVHPSKDVLLREDQLAWKTRRPSPPTSVRVLPKGHWRT